MICNQLYQQVPSLVRQWHDRDTTLERYIRAKSPCYGHYDKPSVAKKAKAKEALRRRMREERKKEKRRLRAEQRRDRRSKR